MRTRGEKEEVERESKELGKQVSGRTAGRKEEGRKLGGRAGRKVGSAGRNERSKKARIKNKENAQTLPALRWVASVLFIFFK
jgi:hypothetical protein